MPQMCTSAVIFRVSDEMSDRMYSECGQEGQGRGAGLSGVAPS